MSAEDFNCQKFPIYGILVQITHVAVNWKIPKVFSRQLSNPICWKIMHILAGSLEAAYSLNWGAQEIWGKGGGETLALLW